MSPPLHKAGRSQNRQANGDYRGKRIWRWSRSPAPAPPTAIEADEDELDYSHCAVCAAVSRKPEAGPRGRRHIIYAYALRRLYSCPISSNAGSKDGAICQTLSASHSARF
jgi:hypothetical protein